MDKSSAPHSSPRPLQTKGERGPYISGALVERIATAVWRGGPGAGEGSVSTSSGILHNVLYTFGSAATGEVPCSNPCEMLAAALASCTSLMVAQEIAGYHLLPQEVHTQAVLRMENLDTGWAVTSVQLHVKGRVPNAWQNLWQKAVESAMAKCPVGGALVVPMSVQAELEPAAEHAVASDSAEGTTEMVRGHDAGQTHC